MNKLKFQLIFLFFTLMPIFLWAQSGKISGTVTDAETGETIIGATVSIQGTTKGVVTDIDGNYLMLNVAPGTYTLEVRYIGYTTIIMEEVVVRTDLTTTQDFALSPETIEGEEITITAERQTVIKDLTSSESRVSKEEIEKLPVQEVSDIIQLQAGVNVGNDGGIHIRGGRSSEVSYVVDGIRVTDDYDRSQGVRIENESIQELQVISGTFNAEHGQALSGIVNVVTKSGSNKYEGSIRGWAGSYLINDEELYDGLSTGLDEVDPNRMHNLSASIGGPIIKDKLTFFVTGRTFKNNGWKRGRNAYSPHGPYYELLPVGVDFDTYRTDYNERIDLSQPWYSMDTVVVQGREYLRVIDDGTRDSSLVNMDTFETYSAQSNLQWKPNSLLKFNLISTYGIEEGSGYDHGRKLVPGGISSFQNLNYSSNLKTTITPSTNTFLTLNAALRYNESQSYLYDDPYDPRYFNVNTISELNNGTQSPFVGDNSISFPGAAQFAEFGTDLGRFSRSTTSYVFKGEISSQISDRHFIKAGMNLQMDELTFDSYSLQPIDSVAGITYPEGTTPEQERFISLGIPGVDNPLRTKFSDSPYSLSAYLQDKIEYESMIINIGLRFDYFEPNAQIPADPRDPDINLPQLPENRYKDLNDNGEQDANEPDVTLEERQEYWYKDASAKYQLSPRFGISYSINENGVIYFSYGYFFQMPSFNYLYQNSRIRLEETDRLQGIYGNPDLKPERSIQFELGLKQEIFEGTAIELVGFSKDTRDYVSTGITQRTYGTPIYQTWINRDYSNSKGLTFAFNQFVSNRVNVGIDYTFSIVEGSNSDPAAEFSRQNSAGAGEDTTGTSLTKLIQPLDWDRSHIINGSLFYSGNNWNFNLLARFLTGTPYTPATNIPGVTTGPNVSGRDLRNTERLPSRFTVDFNFSKDFDIGGDYSLNMFLNVYNLFDARLVNSVFGDSGEPDRPLIVPANYDDTYYEDPNRYSEPRRFQLGIQLNF